MAKMEITNMCMVYNPDTRQVLAQRRIKSWPGVCFPGGHVEPGESFTASAIREIKEETGLDVWDLKLCGIMHWDNLDNQDQYIVYMYRTERFSGTLLESMDEGLVFWTDVDTFEQLDLASNFLEQYRMFWNDEVSEMYIPWQNSDTGFSYEIV